MNVRKLNEGVVYFNKIKKRRDGDDAFTFLGINTKSENYAAFATFPDLMHWVQTLTRLTAPLFILARTS